MAAVSQRLWAPRAWLGGRWRDRVLLGVGDDGCWAEVVPDVAAPAGVETLAGPGLPGLVDAHSHAFQRAFAGLAERRDTAHDDFWSWRDRMYGVALRITPEQLLAIAAHLSASFSPAATPRSASSTTCSTTTMAAATPTRRRCRRRSPARQRRQASA